jgi:hypothetical protein
VHARELLESVRNALRQTTFISSLQDGAYVGLLVKEVPGKIESGKGAPATAKPTLIIRTVGPNLMIMRETFESPRDEEWNEFLKMLEVRGDNVQKLRLLVLTDGGGPNSAQRGRLEAVLKGRPVRVAIVSDSAKSRFIASAISLFNRDHAGFSKDEIRAAYGHLRLTPEECRLAEQALREMEPLIK